MKPAHERNQECLPPKKRDLLVNAVTTTTTSSSSNAGGSGVGGGGGGDEITTSQSSGTSGEPQGGGGSVEWVRAQPSLHYGTEGPESMGGIPVDQYSMLYKVALPSVTYSPTSLHPVLSHISPAYTVPSPLLQHTGIPYPSLSYAPIPHSSLQFVSPPYAAAVPYAVPGFVPSSLISAQSGIPQPHLVPYPSVIQEGLVSSPPQHQVAAHAYTKVADPGGVPLVLAPEQAPTQQQLGAIGMMPMAELNSRGVPIFYHPSSSDRAVLPHRETHGGSVEQEREVNGGDRENGGRESQQDVVYVSRNARPQQAVELHQSRKSSRQEGRASPGQRSTPDMDLEVQQVVGRLASPVLTSRREAAHGSAQSSQSSRDVQGDSRAAYVAHATGQLDIRAPPSQHPAQAGQTVILPNGQPVLMPLDSHPHQQQHLHQQQHYAGQPNNDAAGEYPKVSNASGVPECLVALEMPTMPAASPPSHFTKGAIIQLATGELKRVEDLQTQDFVKSAEVSSGLKIDSSMVVDIRASSQRPGLVALRFAVGERQSKVSIDVPPEHPFFVFGQGWSSCSPEHTAQLYGLACHHLQVGDVCVSVTLQQPSTPHQKPPLVSQQPQQQQTTHSRTSTKANSTSGVPSQPMGPPAPQNSRPQGHLRTERIQRERTEKDESIRAGGLGHGDVLLRPDRTSAEHTRSQSSYYLHSEGHHPSQRRWSTPGFQRYPIKREEGGLVTPPGSSRPSFIPQEVKLSIEGRSNAGK
ncbi:ataxin-1-like isoform X2 [Trichomycterus rosablanca]|uniref:ataxin-1-like isoform X2 n=1 Tax=Trichomycterus rosablanca TaxID=2290929 RepID=UPI002F34F141